MGMHKGPATIAIVEYTHGGVSCDVFVSRLGLVKTMINNGAISIVGNGYSRYYGSNGHLAALDEVEKQIAETRAKIAEQNAREL